jgi:formylglycine-generating enzyme required for sulfatase activity
MMRKAARVHGVRWTTTLAVLLVVGISIQQFVASVRYRNLTERLQTSVNTMGNSPWYKVPDAIADLGEFPRDMVIDTLKRRFADSKPDQKLALACALADYGEVDLEFLLSSIADAPANECVNIVSALDNAKESPLERVAELAQIADGNADWKLKGRLAVIALHLGDTNLAADIHRTKDRTDPTQQTVFIHDVFPSWHVDLDGLAEQMQDVEDSSLRAGMCLAMGKLPTGELGDAKTRWQELLSKWYLLESSDSGTHGAAGWALRQWKVDLPEFAPTTEPDATDRNWKVTPHGFTMVRIPAGQFERIDDEIRQAVTLTQDVWLSDVEVSVQLFLEFMNDESYQGLKPNAWDGVDQTVSPANQHPVQQVGWEDAVLFCNWLSRQEERSPCYQVEPLADAKPEDRSTLKVELLADGTGYRLPTEAEWEYACRAGTTTDFCFGDDAERLIRYALFGTQTTEVTASNMCNRWGLFDMHGNVWEWCYDWSSSYDEEAVSDPVGSAQGEYHVYRGGGWNYSPGRCQSGNRGGYFPSYRSGNVGFRVAQDSLTKPAKKPASEAIEKR